jgi:hypothetical protein
VGALGVLTYWLGTSNSPSIPPASGAPRALGNQEEQGQDPQGSLH